jgi:hypothetical protein
MTTDQSSVEPLIMPIGKPMRVGLGRDIDGIEWVVKPTGAQRAAFDD